MVKAKYKFIGGNPVAVPVEQTETNDQTYADRDAAQQQALQQTDGGAPAVDPATPTDKQENYQSAEQQAAEVQQPQQPAAPVATPATPQQMAQARPQAVDPALAAYQQAVQGQQAATEGQLNSIGDLLRYYHHESPEEREKRERRERITTGITSAMDMVGALGNLGLAAGQRDGRSVRMQPTTEGVQKGQEKRLARIREDNARNIDLRNRYFTLRKAMADQGASSTWNIYMQQRNEQMARDKMKMQALKDARDLEIKLAGLRQKEDAMGEQQRHNKSMERLKAAENTIREKLRSSGGSGTNKPHTKIPLSDKQDEFIEVPTDFFKDEGMRGALEQLLPIPYVKKYLYQEGTTIKTDQNGNITPDSYMRLIMRFMTDTHETPEEQEAYRRMRRLFEANGTVQNKGKENFFDDNGDFFSNDVYVDDSLDPKYFYENVKLKK